MRIISNIVYNYSAYKVILFLWSTVFYDYIIHR